MPPKRERGSAMIIAVVMVLVLAATAVALVTEVAFNYKHTKEARDYDEATIICKAGLERARRALFTYRATPSWDPALALVGSWDPLIHGVLAWNSILAYNDPNQISLASDRIFNAAATDFMDQVKANYDLVKGRSEFTTYLADPHADGAATDPLAPDRLDPAVIFGQNKPFRRGGYHVVLRDNDDDPDPNPLVDMDRTIVATVTATLSDGTQRQMEATLYYTPPVFVPDHAMLSGGDMNVHGAAGLRVQGTYGDIMANQDLDFDGGPYIEGTSSANGTVTGSPGAGSGAVVSGMPAIPLPEVNPRNFWDKATYVFTADGRVIDPATGTELFNQNTDTSGSWNGFKYQKAQGWGRTTGGSPPAGVYAFEADVSLSGSGVYDATFLVEGSMSISGSVTIRPYSTTMGDVGVFVRGDLKAAGNVSGGGVNLEGFYAAHEQMGLGGNVTISGSVMAENRDYARRLINSQIALDAGGSVTITHNGGLNTMIDQATNVSVRQMRQIR
ncbi:MAG: hypothetical protein HY716_16970 [Planctomycetes bacterium]|nr:hypothetical protein [Planctomycetota bacterium]